METSASPSWSRPQLPVRMFCHHSLWTSGVGSLCCAHFLLGSLQRAMLCGLGFPWHDQLLPFSQSCGHLRAKKEAANTSALSPCSSTWLLELRMKVRQGWVPQTANGTDRLTGGAGSAAAPCWRWSETQNPPLWGTARPPPCRQLTPYPAESDNTKDNSSTPSWCPAAQTQLLTCQRPVTSFSNGMGQILSIKNGADLRADVFSAESF